MSHGTLGAGVPSGALGTPETTKIPPVVMTDGISSCSGPEGI